MRAPAWTRSFWLLLALVSFVLCGQAHSQPLQLDAASTALTQPVQLQYTTALPTSASIEDVARWSGEWQNVRPGQYFQPSESAALWLRLPTRADAVQERAQWLLEFASVITDRFEFYQKDRRGVWQVSAAGDRVPYADWPAATLRPRFPLLASAIGDSAVYVRVMHPLPLNLRPVLVNALHSEQRDTPTRWWLGILVGVALTLILTCLQMAWVYRDAVYAWYGGYLFFTALAAACYTSVAQALLWPQGTRFASDAIVLAVMGAYIANLMYVRVMFSRFIGKRLGRAFAVCTALCVGYGASKLLGYDYTFVWLFNLITVSVFCIILWTAAQAWRAGIGMGGFWLVVYLPYALAVSLTLMESSGAIAAPWLINETPIVAAIFEAIAMMLVINAHGRFRHAQAVREQAAAERDPLTGFLTKALFAQAAAAGWDRAHKLRRPYALVYVSVQPAQGQASEGIAEELLMARSVRLLHTATREVDVVGRLGKSLLGVLMPDLPSDESLNQRLVRLVALGLMRDPHDKAPIALRFQIAVGQASEQGVDFAELDKQLRAAIHMLKTDTKTIHHLSHQPRVLTMNAVA